MFCTLNTDKVDTDHILSGQIGLEDIIYVHRKGNRKQVEVKKTVPFLGLTIADNSNGSSYIKKIKEDSTASRVPFIKVSVASVHLPEPSNYNYFFNSILTNHGKQLGGQRAGKQRRQQKAPLMVTLS